MSWRAITVLIAVAGLLAPTVCGAGAVPCPSKAACSSTTACSMSAAAPSLGDCCSMTAPAAWFHQATAARLALDGSASLGLTLGVWTPRPISLAPGNPDLPDRTAAVRSAPLYTLHSTLLI